MKRGLASDARSVPLVLIGLWEMGQGVLVLDGPAVDADNAIPHESLPLGVRAGLWLVCGLITAAFGCSRRLETVAFVVAVAMPTQRAASHFVSWVQWILPGPPGGQQLGMVWALQWLALAGVIWWIARVVVPRSGGRRELG